MFFYRLTRPGSARIVLSQRNNRMDSFPSFTKAGIVPALSIRSRLVSAVPPGRSACSENRACPIRKHPNRNRSRMVQHKDSFGRLPESMETGPRPTPTVLSEGRKPRPGSALPTAERDAVSSNRRTRCTIQRAGQLPCRQNPTSQANTPIPAEIHSQPQLSCRLKSDLTSGYSRSG